MDSRLLERVVIIILLLLNGILLGIVLTDQINVRRGNAETERSVTALLTESGIQVGDGVELLQKAPPRCTLVRDLEKEQRRADTVLGKSGMEDQGGNILFYRGSRGQAVFRGSGGEDFLMNAGAYPLRFGLERTVQRILEDMRLEGRLTPLEDGSMDACCCWNGYPVYNAVLNFSAQEDAIYMITGTGLFERQTASEDVGRDSVWALLQFVELVKNEGRICSRLDRLEPGYLMEITASGESQLSPVWRIQTDTGVTVLNAETGKTEAAA